jgi:hypothetical protein
MQSENIAREITPIPVGYSVKTRVKLLFLDRIQYNCKKPCKRDEQQFSLNVWLFYGKI